MSALSEAGGRSDRVAGELTRFVLNEVLGLGPEVEYDPEMERLSRNSYAADTPVQIAVDVPQPAFLVLAWASQFDGATTALSLLTTAAASRVPELGEAAAEAADARTHLGALFVQTVRVSQAMDTVVEAVVAVRDAHGKLRADDPRRAELATELDMVEKFGSELDSEVRALHHEIESTISDTARQVVHLKELVAADARARQAEAAVARAMSALTRVAEIRAQREPR